jgi:hypothetical protein
LEEPDFIRGKRGGWRVKNNHAASLDGFYVEFSEDAGVKVIALQVQQEAIKGVIRE